LKTIGGEPPPNICIVGSPKMCHRYSSLRVLPSPLAPPSGPGIAGGDGNTRNELYLWHIFGDPTMQMFGGGSPPIVFNPAIFKAIYKELPIPRPGDPPPFEVNVTFPTNIALAGQPVSLLRNGQVIGKALAGDGSVKIAAEFNDGLPKPGELQVAVDANDAAPVTVPVEGGTTPPPPPPPLPPTKADLIVTDLVASSVTVKNQGGTLAPAFVTTITTAQAGAQVLNFGPLAPGESATVSWNCGFDATYVATADARFAVDESDETNNTLSKPITGCST